MATMPRSAWAQTQNMDACDYVSREYSIHGERQRLTPPRPTSSYPGLEDGHNTVASHMDWRNHQTSTADDMWQDLSAESTSDLPLGTEDSPVQLCPILTGQTSDCNIQICGPNPPCSNLTIPEIEDCAFDLPISAIPPQSTVNESKRRSLDFRIPAIEEATEFTAQANTETMPTQTVSRNKSSRKSKQAHSLVERKYRDNLNAKISQLHCTLQRSNSKGNSILNPSTSKTAEPDSQVRKGDVLADAISYVEQAEVEMRHMRDEIRLLNRRVKALEKLVRCEDCEVLKRLALL